MEVAHRLTAVLPIGVVAVHVGGHGPGAVQRHQGGHVVEARRRQRPHERAHGPALELEDADRVAALEHGEGGVVVERDGVDVGTLSLGLGHEVEGPFDDREVAQAEEVHLEQPELLDAVHLVLGDDGSLGGVLAALGLALDGQVLGERLLGDDHRGGVDAVLAPQALESLGHVDDPAGLLVGGVHLAQALGRGVAVVEPLDAVETGPQGRVSTHDERRHRLGDAVAHQIGIAQHPRRVAHRGPRLDRREGHDLRHPVGAVALGGVADHLAAVALVEVHVDVGHLLAPGVQEPLEEQVVADGVEVHDPEAVGDAAPRGRAPPRAHPDPALPGMADQVPDHQEVRREAHAGDDAELVVDALAHRFGQRRAVPALGARQGRDGAGRRRPVARRCRRRIRRAPGTPGGRSRRTRSRRWPAPR